MDIPVGYCQCGCGARTRQYTRNDFSSGRIKGQYARYIINHHPQGDADRDARIIQEYSVIKNATRVAVACGVSTATVINVLNRNNLPHNGPGHHLAKTLNHSAFDEINERSAYWIGFLMADGCITEPRGRTGSPSVSVSLSERDVAHLELFRSFVGSLHKIHHYTVPSKVICGNRKQTNPTNAVAFRFASHRITSRLAEFGVVPRKSNTAECLGGLESNRDFWRGVVDGDGCLSIAEIQARRSITRRPTIQVCGSHAIVSQFCKWVNGNLPHRRRPVIVHPFSTIWKCVINGRDAITITKELYDNCSVALLRKYAIAKDIIGIPYVSAATKDKNKNVYAPNGMSWCYSCKEYLPLKSFGPSVNRINGVRGQCRECRRISR